MEGPGLYLLLDSHLISLLILEVFFLYQLNLKNVHK